MGDIHIDPDKARRFAPAVTATFARHMERLRATSPVSQNAALMGLAQQADSLYRQNAVAIAAEVIRVYTDAQPRSWSVLSKRDRLLLYVSAVPCSLADGRAYYVSRSVVPGYGYSEALNEILNSREAEEAAENGAIILAHLILFCDRRGGTLAVHLCVAPLREGTADQVPGVVFPVDLLTELERARFGV